MAELPGTPVFESPEKVATQGLLEHRDDTAAGNGKVDPEGDGFHLADARKVVPEPPATSAKHILVEDVPAIPRDTRSKDELLLERLRVAMVTAVADNSMAEVQSILDEKVDPNAQMFYKVDPSPKMFEGRPLTLAVKLAHRELVDVLLKAGADVNSYYYFKAGAERVRLGIPAAGAAINPTKKLSMLKLLHAAKAELGGRVMTFNGEPNATLLYEACYVGHLPSVKYLLKNKSDDIELEVKHQDNLKESRTPLHIAAQLGFCEVAEELLKNWDAKLRPDDGRGRGPPALADAIEMGRVSMVRLLVKSSADIFEGKPPNPREGEEGTRGIDFIFRTNNTVIIAAVAAGLGASQDPKVVERMLPADFVTFLMTPSCEEIFDAVFRRKNLVDWRGRKRFTWLNAHIPDGSIKLNVADGPNYKTIEDLFNARMRVDPIEQDKIDWSIYEEDPQVRKFMDTLMPGRRSSLEASHRMMKQVPIETRFCVLKEIHNDVDVVRAMAHGPNQTAFDHPGAQALVMYGWNKARLWYQSTFVFNLLLASDFMAFCFFLNYEAASHWKYASAVLATILWLRNTFYEVLQMIGLASLGHMWSYVCDVGNFIDFIRIALTGYGIIAMYNYEKIEMDELCTERIFLALVMFLLWNKVLYCQRGFLQLGEYMLPILTAIQATWPFMGIMIPPTIGFANAYYMLHVYPQFFRAVSMVYRAGYVGDFDIEEVEDIDPHFGPTEDDPSVLETIDPVWTEYHGVYAIFLFAVTMLFAIIMMNILIGVLGESYNQAYSNKHRIFLHSRACIAFENYAVTKAWNLLFGRCCRRPKASNFLRSSTWGGGSKSPDDTSHHLWYCKPLNMEELGLPDEDDDDGIISGENVHDLVKNLTNDLQNFKNEMLARLDDHHIDKSVMVGSLRRDYSAIVG